MSELDNIYEPFDLEESDDCSDELERLSTDEFEENTDELSLSRDDTEMWEEGLEANEEVLDNYRENLRDYGVTDETKIESFIADEREKMMDELRDTIEGNLDTPYEIPSDWEQIASEMKEDEPELTESLDAQEIQEIDYDSILEEIQEDALAQGFENVDIEADSEKLEESLENFKESEWKGMTLEEQKTSMEELADYVAGIIGLNHQPPIEYYYSEVNGDYGGYDHETNTLKINEYMLHDSKEAADTIAHELWHTYQYERADNPQSARDYQYQYNFENYIPPELGQELYENQLVEAEARLFARQFKDRIKGEDYER